MVVKEHHQKQLPEVFCKKIYSSKFIKFHRKTLASECLFNKVACLNACNFIKKRLWHRCFPVKFVKFSRTPILKNICERLLLHHGYSRLATFNRSFWKLHISNYVKLLCTSFSYFRLFAVSLVSSLFLVSLQLSSLYTYFFVVVVYGFDILKVTALNLKMDSVVSSSLELMVQIDMLCWKHFF